MGHLDHKEKAKKSVSCFVVTVSDTRTPDDDESGAIIKEKLVGDGHEVAGYRVVADDKKEIRGALGEGMEIAEAVIFNGGTGVSRRDCAYEVISRALDKKLPGFGELFRALSHEEIGSAAIMSRAVAGVVNGRAVFSIPGSSNAVKLAMDRIILPELAHLVWEANR